MNLLLQILTDDIVMVLLTDFHAIQSQEGNTAVVHIRPSHLPSGIFEDWTPSAPHGLVLNHELQVSCHGVKNLRKQVPLPSGTTSTVTRIGGTMGLTMQRQQAAKSVRNLHRVIPSEQCPTK